MIIGINVTSGNSPPAVPGLKWHAVVYIFQSVLFFWFFSCCTAPDRPHAASEVAVAEEQAIFFLQLSCHICFFFGFFLVHLAAATAASLVIMSQDTGLFSIKRPREVCDSHSFGRRKSPVSIG